MKEIKEVLSLIKQTDCLENKMQVLHQGKISIEEDKKFIFTTGDGSENVILFNEQSVEILRKGEQETKIKMAEATGDAIVESGFGQIIFGAKLIFQEKKESSWVIEYQLLDGEEIILHTHLFCQW